MWHSKFAVWSSSSHPEPQSDKPVAYHKNKPPGLILLRGQNLILEATGGWLENPIDNTHDVFIPAKNIYRFGIMGGTFRILTFNKTTVDPPNFIVQGSICDGNKV
jgi:hypothetical protein